MNLTVKQIEEEFELAKQELLIEDLENINLDNVNIDEHNKLMIYVNNEYESQNIEDETYFNTMQELIESDSMFNDFKSNLNELILSFKSLWDIELSKEITKSKNKMIELFTKDLYLDMRFYTISTKEEQEEYFSSLSNEIYKINENKLKEFNTLL